MDHDPSSSSPAAVALEYAHFARAPDEVAAVWLDAVCALVGGWLVPVPLLPACLAFFFARRVFRARSCTGLQRVCAILGIVGAIVSLLGWVIFLLAILTLR